MSAPRDMMLHMARVRTVCNAVNTASYLLVAPLHAAVPLKQVDCVVVRVCKDLDLDVPRPLDEALQQHAVIAKGRSRLSLCRLYGLLHSTLMSSLAMYHISGRFC